MKNLISQLFGQGGFWIINKEFAKKFGIETALLLSDLISKWEYFNYPEWFFNTADNIEKDTSLSRYKQTAALKILEKNGFVETKLMGVPAKLHFKILENKFSNFFKTGFQKTSKLYNNNKDNNNKEEEEERNFALDPEIEKRIGLNSLKPLNEVFQTLDENQQWKEAICMNHNIQGNTVEIKLNNLQKLLNEFYNHLSGDMQVKEKSLQDTYSHFANWLRKKKEYERK